MLESLIPYLRCPACSSTPLRHDNNRLICPGCGACCPIRGGILDMLGAEPPEVITPFQRVMQMQLVVSIYERIWRRLGYFLASSRSFDKEISTVMGMNRGRDSSRVLDLACGPGVFTRPLAAQSHGIVVGLDLSWPMLRQARHSLQKAGIGNVVLIRGSAFGLPFVDGTFSYINCCGALHLFDRPDDALREIDRVLERDGHLAVQTTIRPAKSGGIAFFLERVIRFGFFDKSALDQKILQHGFKVIKDERHRISYTFLARHIS